MANRYKFNVKKEIGNVKKLQDTLYADDIKHACKNFADLVDVKILDESYTYFLGKIDDCVQTKRDYVLLKFDYNNEEIETFIEKVN